MYKDGLGSGTGEFLMTRTRTLANPARTGCGLPVIFSYRQRQLKKSSYVKMMYS